MKKFSKILLLTLFCCILLSLSACVDDPTKQELPAGQMRITIGDKSFVADLAVDESQAAAQLEKILPMTLTMHTLNDCELYGNVDGRTFTEQAEPSGILDAGDIMLQGANRLVLFYNFDNSNDALTRIGKVRAEDIDSFAEAVKQAVQSATNGTITIKFSK